MGWWRGPQLDRTPDREARPPRALLPLVAAAGEPAADGARCGSSGPRRAAMTCRFRCGNACARPAPNRSDNPYLGDMVAAAVSRRSLLRAVAVIGAAGAATAACGGAPGAPPAAPAPGAAGTLPPAPPGLGFAPVAANTADVVTVPPGYRQQVLVRWGEPIIAGAPGFNPARQSAAAQAVQFGYNCDYLAMLPASGPGAGTGGGPAVLVANHEFTNEVLMFPGYDENNPTREQVEIGLAAHGMSVLALDDRGGPALAPLAGHPLNRRITATTPCTLTGPAAGSPLLATAADPAGTTVAGTLNNCGGGVTPWGTVLSGEENFNQYFANPEAVTEPGAAARLERYGFEPGPSERKWERFDPRFDLAREPQEVNRFGWVVEIDPRDPTSAPRKRTALGRFKHEAAEPRVAPDGRVVLYMGDDERFDYFYKYVSRDPMTPLDRPGAREANQALLDEGTLYVARFDPAAPIEPGRDGAGQWIALARGAQSLVPGMRADEVYVFTREAADRVGATKMDRPEDVEPHPTTGTVYVALTNNEDRGTPGEAGVDAANPRPENKHGHVLEITDGAGDPTAETFGWRLFLACGDPADPSTFFAGFPQDQVSPISCPDNVAFDPHGNLWLATDGNALEANDGLFAVATAGDQRGRLAQFLTVPIGAETCGPIIGRDRILVAVQHPGEKDGATATAPVSTWPDGPGTLARPSVIVVTRDDNGPIGA